MTRKLVVCCDGTWNTPRNETNVFRTYRFLRERLGAPAELSQKNGVITCGGRAADGSEVLLFYDRGIGTDWFSRLAGGAAGVRLGDDVGSLPRHTGVKIRFIGVYDTVGALGVPLAVAATVNEPIVGFHDTTLGDIVEHAVQALAVDERRGPYLPTLWTQAADAAALAGQSVLQVWFPGVHSDIGGGYGDKGVGDITWDFMMRQAADRGLVIDPNQRTPPLTLDPLPAQHESFDKKWRELSDELKLVPEGVRSVGPTTRGPRGETLTVATKVCLHPSLVGRLGKRCVTILNEGQNLRREGEYLPANVKADTLPVF